MIARIFALIGPGMPLDGSFAAGNFVRDALHGQTITINGDGRPVRSFLYMADLCVWLLRILHLGECGHAYNVGSESSISIIDFAKKIASVSGLKSDIVINKPADFSAVPSRYVPDTNRARRELNLSEYTEMDLALIKTIQWHMNMVNS